MNLRLQASCFFFFCKPRVSFFCKLKYIYIYKILQYLINPYSCQLGTVRNYQTALGYSLEKKKRVSKITVHKLLVSGPLYTWKNC